MIIGLINDNANVIVYNLFTSLIAFILLILSEKKFSEKEHKFFLMIDDYKRIGIYPNLSSFNHPFSVFLDLTSSKVTIKHS